MTPDAAAQPRWKNGWLRPLTSGGFAPALPALVYLFVFMVLPIGTLLLFGFVNIERGRIVDGSFTLQPMFQALNDSLVWRLMWRSFWVAAVSSLLTLVLAYPVAYV